MGQGWLKYTHKGNKFEFDSLVIQILSPLEIKVYRALICEFDGVPDQIREDLSQPERITQKLIRNILFDENI